MKKIKFILCLLISLLVVFSSGVLAAEEETAEDTDKNIKIGLILPNWEAYDDVIAYTYYASLIDELTKFTNWHYEIVSIRPEEIVTSLQAGTVDVVLPVEYNPARLDRFAYTRHDDFNDLLGLFQRKDEQRFNKLDLQTLNNAKIGIFENRAANSFLEDFLQKNNLQVSLSIYPDKKSIAAALENKEIDLIADSLTNVYDNEKYLLGLSLIPTRAMALQEKAFLLADIDNAMDTWAKEDPGHLQAINAYSARRVLPQLTYFTPSETAYLKQCTEMRVVFYGEESPYIIYHQKDDTFTGIYPDLFKLITADTGINFVFKHTDNLDNAIKMLKNDEADIMINSYTNDPLLTRDFYVSNTIYRQQCVLITRKNDPFTTLKDKKIMINSGIDAAMHFLETVMPYSHLAARKSLSECLDAIENHQADYVLTDAIKLQAERQLIMFPELTIAPEQTIDIPVCLYISHQHPAILRSILNKSITRMPQDVVQQLVIRNAVEAPLRISPRYIFLHYPLQAGLFLGFLLLIISIAFFTLHHTNKMHKQQRLLKRKNIELRQTLEELQKANQAKDKYKAKAEIDELTGVLNKNAIQEFISGAIKQIGLQKNPDAFIIIDMDNFKEANDSRGHQYGDKVLRDFAHNLIRLTRQGDAVGRFGGDEFILYLRNVNPAKLPDVGRRILTASHQIDPAQKPPLSASIGIVPVLSSDFSYEILFERADEALYFVKSRGRNNFHIITDPLNPDGSNPEKKV